MVNIHDKKYESILGEGKLMSPVQEELCNFIAHGVGNATVQSRAGSGKSKTIELMCASINPRKKILILAHNVHIANHLRHKLNGHENITIYTYHSLGYKVLKTKLKSVELSLDLCF